MKTPEQIAAEQQAINDAMEAAYSGTEPEETDDTTAEQTTEQSAAKPADDKTESAAPAEPESSDLEKRVMGQVANLIDGRLRNHTGHFNKILDERLKSITPADTKAATAAAKDAGADAPTNTQISEAMKSGTKFKALQEDFPEWAEALAEQTAIQSAEIEANVLKKMPQPDTSRFATSDAVASLAEEIVDSVHPTWRDDVLKPEFSKWLGAQADDVKALTASERPSDAIKLMKKFYAETSAETTTQQGAPPKTSNQSRLKSAAAIHTGANKPPAKSMSLEDAMEYGYNHT
jgi:hypothetical protein